MRVLLNIIFYLLQDLERGRDVHLAVQELFGSEVCDYLQTAWYAKSEACVKTADYGSEGLE